MKLRELLVESTSRETTLRAVISGVWRVKIDQIYRRLTNMAENYAANNGTLDGFAMVAGGMSHQWFQRAFVDDLQKNLESLVQFLPRASADLLRSKLSYKEHLGKLKDVESSLPSTLIQIGRAIKSMELVKAAEDWIQERDRYHNFVQNLKDELESDKLEFAKKPVSKPKDTETGKQKDQAEQLVNDIINELPERIRGEIRQAIARDDNKLMALQRELTKRNIKLGK